MTTNAQRLARINIALIIVCSILLVICIARQLWVPAFVNAVFIASNAFQLVNGRRSQ